MSTSNQIYVFPDLDFRTKVYTREKLEEVLSQIFTKFYNDGVEVIKFLENTLVVPVKEEPKIAEVVSAKPPTQRQLILEALQETAEDMKRGGAFDYLQMLYNKEEVEEVYQTKQTIPDFVKPSVKKTDTSVPVTGSAPVTGSLDSSLEASFDDFLK